MSSPVVVKAIIDALEKDQARTWSQDELAKHVLNNYQTGLKNTFHIEAAIRTLVSVERIAGDVRGSKAQCIAYKPDQDESTLRALKSSVDTIKKLQADLAAVKATKPEDAVKLQEKVAAITRELDDAKAEAALQAEAATTLRKKLDESRVFEVVTTDASGEKRSTTGLFHSQFKRILKLAAHRKNMFIYGPTGCGKTHVCAQVAEALGLRFKFVSCTSGMSEGQLTGRLMPTGENGKFEFIMSELVDCYENGGLFLFDEIDAADANVLLVINAALSNGQLAVPNRPDAPYAKKHPDFVCIAAANTVGTGASRTYSGRNKLDMATLDRFNIGKILMDYDAEVEAKLCPDETLRTTLLRWRRAINDHGMERAMSTRFLIDSYDMMFTGPEDMRFDMRDVEAAFFQGWREDEVNKVKSFRG